MNKTVIILSVIFTVGILFSGCDSDAAPGTLTDVTIMARTADSGSRAVNPGDPVEIIDSYSVVFTKVEIGNSEEEKFTLWEESTRVPLILSVPGLTKPGTTCDQPASLMDLYPTLVELAGFEFRHVQQIVDQRY